MTRSTWRRAATTMIAAASALAMSAPGAGAAGAGPAVFSGSAEALTLDLRITAPAALLEPLGVAGGVLSQRISSTVSQLDSAGKVDATAKLLTGDLLNEALESSGQTSDRKVIAEQQLAGGLVDVGVGTMEYTADAVGKLSRSFSELAHVDVSIAPLFATDSPVPAEVRDALQGAVADATETVNGLVGELNGELTKVEEAVNEATSAVEEGTGIDIPDVLPDQLPQVPDVTRVSLLSAQKLWSESEVTTDGDAVVATSEAGLLQASLLGGLVRVPAFQYNSIARATGETGGAFADATTKVIAVQLADDTTVEIAGSTLKVGDFTLDLNDPKLANLDGNELLDPVKDVLEQILDAAGLSVSQGAADTFAAPDGTEARASTSAFAIGLHPLNAAGMADTLGIDVNLLPTATQVKAAGEPPQEVHPPAAPAPAPAPEPPVQLPRTGGGAFALLLGASGMAGALRLMRKR